MVSRWLVQGEFALSLPPSISVSFLSPKIRLYRASGLEQISSGKAINLLGITYSYSASNRNIKVNLIKEY